MLFIKNAIKNTLILLQVLKSLLLWGKLDDSSEIKHNVNIYSYKNHYLNVQTSNKLAKNIRDFMDREYLSDL
ncbi:hypothetical protein AAUPMB_03101, partial [Pasteurella multocida subsp. multocida str. Anand1_buffalo]